MTSEYDVSCVSCGASDAIARLERCRMCRKSYCGDCAVRARGGQFCSRPCAEAFTFGDEDEEEG